MCLMVYRHTISRLKSRSDHFFTKIEERIINYRIFCTSLNRHSISLNIHRIRLDPISNGLSTIS